MERSPSYNLDYLNTLQDLPQNEFISLAAVTDAGNEARPSTYSPDKQVLLSSIIEHKEEEDRIWKISQRPFRFYAKNAQGERLLIESTGQPIVLFNLHEVAKGFSPPSASGLLLNSYAI